MPATMLLIGMAYPSWKKKAGRHLAARVIGKDAFAGVARANESRFRANPYARQVQTVGVPAGADRGIVTDAALVVPGHRFAQQLQPVRVEREVVSLFVQASRPRGGAG